MEDSSSVIASGASRHEAISYSYWGLLRAEKHCPRYNPDRLQNAVRQSGGRGSRQFKPIQWTEALDQLSSAFKSVSSPSRVAFLGGLMSDHLLALVSRFLKAAGAPPPVIFDLHTALEGRAEAADMARRWFGKPQLPLYDIARAQVVFSFGAN